MNPLITTFWNICRYRLGPQDLPGSTALLGMVVFAYVVISTSVAGFNLPPAPAFFSALLDAGIIAGVTRLLLWVRELDTRMVQTTTALLGVGTFFGLIAVPLMWWQLSYEDPTQAFLPSFLMLSLFVWNLAVMGHILRHALNVAFYVGVLLAVLYMYISISILRALFAIPAGQ